MLKILAASALALSLFACSKSGGSPLAAFKTQACACKTAECARAVNAKADAVMDKMTAMPSEADMNAVTEMSKCLAPLMSADAR